jgi:citrate lyase subunit beta / citryl-CoA lyase
MRTDARSWLFVPGDRPDRFDKALASGADAVILDLEDGVAPAARPTARRNLAEWLPGRSRDVPVLVRLSHRAAPAGDLMAATGADGIVVPKVESTIDLALYAGWETVVVIVESAAGLLAAPALAAHSTTTLLMIGEYDLCADLGSDLGPADIDLDPLRLQVVVASAAAGLAPPIAAVDAEFRDPRRLEATTRHLGRLGFGSRAIIHPAQVEPVHAAFTPDPAAVASARALVARFDEALAAGRGALVDDDGRMMDEATVRRARRLIARAPDR